MNKHYYYHLGCNIQAYIAYIVGIALPFAGFLGTLGVRVPDAALHLGDLGWMISFVASFSVYCSLCLVWPTKSQTVIKEQGFGWEQAADGETAASDSSTIRDSENPHGGDSADSKESVEELPMV